MFIRFKIFFVICTRDNEILLLLSPHEKDGVEGEQYVTKTITYKEYTIEYKTIKYKRICNISLLWLGLSAYRLLDAFGKRFNIN